jgi:hypothetical protein
MIPDYRSIFGEDKKSGYPVTNEPIEYSPKWDTYGPRLTVEMALFALNEQNVHANLSNLRQYLKDSPLSSEEIRKQLESLEDGMFSSGKWDHDGKNYLLFPDEASYMEVLVEIASGA